MTSAMRRRFVPLAVGLLTAAVLAFLVAPLAVVFPLSLSSGELLVLPPPGYSLRWFGEFFTSSRWLAATWNSLVVGLATTVLATLTGTLAAIGLHLAAFRGRTVVIALLTLPMVTPVIVTAVSMYFAFAMIGLTSTFAGLVLAHTVLAAPYVLLTVLAALQSFDTALLRAAASLGADPATAFRRVLLPLLAPAIGAGALFAFATSFDELIVALFIAGPEQFTLPRQMYAGVREFLSPTIAAAAVILIGVSILLLALNEAIRARAAGAVQARLPQAAEPL